MGHTIETQRLLLATMSADFLEASIEGDVERAENLLGSSLPASWPPYLDVLAMRLARVSVDPTLEPWLTRVIVEKASHRVVGVTGFHGPPAGDWLAEYAPGGLEFGYTVFEEHRRAGFATEAGRGLVEWAWSEHEIALFVLSMSPNNAASAGVARALGFQQVGSWEHEERGTEHVYRLDRSDTAQKDAR